MAPEEEGEKSAEDYLEDVKKAGKFAEVVEEPGGEPMTQNQFLTLVKGVAGETWRLDDEAVEPWALAVWVR